MSLDSLLKLGDLSKNLSKIKSQIQEGSRRVFLSGLAGSGKSFLLAYLYQDLRLPILLITLHPEESAKIYDDLCTFLGKDSVSYFPEREVLPYEFRTPHTEVIGERLLALYDLVFKKNVVVVATIRSVMEKTIPPDLFKDNCINLKVGQDYDVEELVHKLVVLGFNRLPQVEEVGSFSLRGGILDVFPYSMEDPIRMEFFGETLDSLREFSVITQRTIERINQAVILPKREFLIADEQLEEYLSKLESSLADKLREKISFYQEVPGLEWLAGLFGLPRASLLDYLPDSCIIFLDELSSLQEEIEYLKEQTQKLYEEARKKEEVAPSPAVIWESPEDLRQKVDRFRILENVSLREKGKKTVDLLMSGQEAFHSRVSLLKRRIKEYTGQGFSVHIFCDNESQKNRLLELLDQDSLDIKTEIGFLGSGFTFPELKLVVLSDHEIFSRQIRATRKPRFKEGLALSSYSALSDGDFVVHIDFGIGRYAGLKNITVDGRKRDCLLILYQGDDKLYVPIEEFNRVHKFIGKEGEPPISRLGGTSWERLKRKTKKAIQEMAKELIELYAERKAKPGFAFSVDDLWMAELESSFPYEETSDQIKAIKDIRSDMEKPIPLDRLVCGDVGYGKTEVGIRAAFKCVMDGKQVAVLVPTTILAQQHLLTFTGRLKDLPVRVEMLSRFKSRKEQKKIVEDLKKGRVDVVIGTHRLLQKDIQFNDLGLVIIDEEQRFGVAHKEKLKKLKRLVDVLTLTATPIPRTMQLSLYGAKDLSVINTPPKERLPIHTEISKFDPELITDAVLKETARGGQVYFVHNRVQSIESMRRFLSELLPEIRIGVAHGQMNERSLEKVMISFLDGKYDLLLATSIIESGLDIPRVNTLIVNRADRFGLADLYQLRGRVGRSNQKAYAYLLVPPLRLLTPEAKKRLKAIQQFTELGSGFYLALRDLEIRGAGNLLGPQQHGFIQEVGFDLYCRLLEEAVKELKGEEIVKRPEVKLSLDLDLYIPEEYIPSPQQRVEIYQRIADAKNSGDLGRIEEELKDRFGEVHPQVMDILTLAEAKLIGENKGITRISMRKGLLEIEFHPEKGMKKEYVEKISRELNYPLAFPSDRRFKIKLSQGKEENQASFVKKVLQKL
jgi:transcription-repair coupling factor (superfamily II helicase)